MAQLAEPMERKTSQDRSPYVSMHLEQGRPEVSLTLGIESPRSSGAAVVSLAAHLVFALLLVLALRQAASETTAPDAVPEPNYQLVFLSEPGPGGGGGGGGNQQQEPPRRLEMPGRDALSVPVAPKPNITPPKQEPPKADPPEVPPLNIPVQTVASGSVPTAGVIDITAPPAPTTSQGTGTGGGGGTGRGPGVGPGDGSGLGPGSGGGTGGGVYRAGSGVSEPQLITQVKPLYTTEAMRAKIQGRVWLDVVVMPDGRPGEISVYRSLDRTFGLDEEAIKAMRQWRFRPGLRNGVAVPVAVIVEMEFTLR